MSPGSRDSPPPTLDALDIPDQPYFRIGQVAGLLGVETHVIRFWEQELPRLRPTRAPSGRRIYHADDIRRLYLARHLLHREGYTIAGARRRLDELLDQAEAAQPQSPQTPAPQAEDDKPPEAIVGELRDILRLLD